MEYENNLSHALFRETVEGESFLLKQLGMKWREISEAVPIPEDVLGEVHVAIGQSELLIRERFYQFLDLITDSELHRSEKEITLQDLQGFWDIIWLQVEGIKKNFMKLDKLKENDWIQPSVKNLHNSKQAPTLKRRPLAPCRAKQPGANSNLREHILAQKRKMLQKKLENSTFDSGNDHKENMEDLKKPAAMDEGHESSPIEVKNFDAGFFKVATPVQMGRSQKRIRQESPILSNDVTPVKVLASTALRTQVENTPFPHKDYSPCMRITRSMKKSRLSNLTASLSK